jgi:L-threonylcarbamoyladenylate synthase
MELLHVDPSFPDPAIIARAADALRSGRLVAFPTETVYGLGANALDPNAVERIYAAKGRPAYNPLIVHIANASDATMIAAEWPERAALLAREFWPGPLTIVLPKKPNVPDGVTAGLPSVAIRVPAHPVARALLDAARIPIAAPSANRSMMLSPTTAAHVAKSLGDSVDIILDGGATNVGIESTVIDLTSPTPTVLRPGTIHAEDLTRVIGPISVARREQGEIARRSPGMLERHYSPRARLVLVESREVALAVAREREHGRIIGALVIDAEFVPGTVAVTSRMPRDSAVYASRLYDSLHAMDDAGCDVIVVERVPAGHDWAGVRDRLERAAYADAR